MQNDERLRLFPIPMAFTKLQLQSNPIKRKLPMQHLEK